MPGVDGRANTLDSNGNFALRVVAVTAADAESTSVQGVDADGATITGNPVLTGGVDGTGKVQSISTDSTGALNVVTASTKPSTATLTNVASLGTTVQLLAANASRLGASIYNDSTQIVYVKLGTTASATSYTVQLGPNGFYELPNPAYTGRIDGIWVSANGSARVTELT